MTTKYERAAYEPSDEVRVFDGGEDEEDVEGSRLPLLIVIALLVLAAFGGVVWLAYQRGVAQGHAEVPRVIAADAGPARVPPAHAGGTPTPLTGLKIYQQPAPSNEDADADSAPLPPSETLPPKPAPVASTPAIHPESKPQTVLAQAPPTKSAAVPTVAAPAPPETPAATASAIPSATPSASGGGLLQIGAYKSEADANAAWNTYKAKHASLLAGNSPNIKQVDLGAKGTWYRLRVDAGSKDAATALCDKLKTEGGICFPAK